MAAHVEDHEDQLRHPQQLPADSTPEYFAGIGHAMHSRISLLELANDISGVCGNGCQAYYDQDTPENKQSHLTSSAFGVPGPTYGSNPNTAIADGRDKILSETVSATITSHFHVLLTFCVDLRM